MTYEMQPCSTCWHSADAHGTGPCATCSQGLRNLTHLAAGQVENCQPAVPALPPGSTSAEEAPRG